MRNRVLLAAVLSALSGFSAPHAWADDKPAADKKPNMSDAKGKEGAAASVGVLNEAERLVEYARDNESPLAMLTAVQMIERVHVKTGKSHLGDKGTEAVTPSTEPAKAQTKKLETPKPSVDPAELLTEAKAWAKDDPAVSKLIDQEMVKAKATGGGTLGASGGAIVHSDSVNARAYDTYTITFTGDELARIAIIGDGDTDLDLFIYDENGNLVGKDDDASDKCLVQFVPRWTGKFIVRVVNNGHVFNRYLLMTN